jgi:hypothetical protein
MVAAANPSFFDTNQGIQSGGAAFTGTLELNAFRSRWKAARFGWTALTSSGYGARSGTKSLYLKAHA